MNPERIRQLYAAWAVATERQINARRGWAGRTRHGS